MEMPQPVLTVRIRVPAIHPALHWPVCGRVLPLDVGRAAWSWRPPPRQAVLPCAAII